MMDQNEIIRARRKRVRSVRSERYIDQWRPPLMKTFRPVPRIWDDETCYILGGGPSLAKFDASQLMGKHVIVVNNSYKLAFWAEVLFFGDCWWFEQHRKPLQSFSGLIITTCCYQIHAFRRVMHIRQKLNRFGLSKNRAFLTWNMNAGACAVNVAKHLGASRIVLLGYDMRQIDNCNNWHHDHMTSDDPSHDPYEEFLLAWPYIARDAKRDGLEIINATPGSAITHFPIINPQDIVKGGFFAERGKRSQIGR